MNAMSVPKSFGLYLGHNLASSRNKSVVTIITCDLAGSLPLAAHWAFFPVSFLVISQGVESLHLG